ncbi:unnamed protein product [Eruca vesicaria subsp. sativa]|uniref:SMP domain-containing protein n=1 Tax=Eruca vesicaria subsp. sativa TaxID=29727 RepID=A0ABC8LUF6_ERUVS|nr:unnamed protein product [Eruca vesicaria subsp. sativa]
MSQQQLEKPISDHDVKEEAAVTERSIVTAEDKEKGVVADGQASKEEVVANPPASEGTITIGNKPVEWSDAAAIQAAEVRATGRTNIMPGGVAASAQSAATLNARANSEDDKTTLAVVLAGARSKLPSDKPATRKDAEGVTGAEMRNDPHLTTYPTGVAASVAAAARINQAK